MKLLCFDLDNTLVNSTKVHIEAFQRSFQKNKAPKRTRKQILDLFSLETAELLKKLYPNLTNKERKKLAKDHDQFLIRETVKYTKPIPGVKATLKKLKKKYKIVIISNCKTKEIKAILKAARIKPHLFDKIIGNDQVKHGKPAPDEIIKAEQLLQLKDGYMIGDSMYDIKAGKKAKVKTIAVLTGTHTRKQLQKENPWKILKSVKELQKIL